ncbi:HAD family hydrolase [Chitinophaga nivalis]|uniref:HAD family hydrolase n=1 Tax=Chitinophaga nivalis TaxID=2991709 RepID=A0ABT3IQC4_9BACT|nr:HAD family hydrolase [Chitinophaga nivalis]MCW3464141.1 HAD family hydrolase [Chitinophaga nivalis]MCW3486169.1 HAD family hydrolase [Chitinophaga nivalis]
MKYIIFDIDGTLTDTTEIDDHCFTRALSDTFGFQQFETNYGHYENTTDSGIIDQLFRERNGRTYTLAEREAFITHFCVLLEQSYAQDPHHFREIRKAGKILTTLCRQETVSIGLATGGWRQSALFKLQCAGIDITGCAAASFAQDAIARRDIIGHTIRQLNEKNRYEAPLSDIIYVGDGKWDYQATCQLGIGFIGIDNKKIAHLEDIIRLTDYDELFRHIDVAALS